MNAQMYELTLDQLSEVYGGGKSNPVPGGTVEKGDGFTRMTFGNTRITIFDDGSMTTSTTVPVPK